MSSLRLTIPARFRKKRLLLIVPLVVGLVALRQLAAFRPSEIQGRGGWGNIGGRPTAIAWSPDGKTLVCATDNDYLQMWMPDIERWRSFMVVNQLGDRRGWASGQKRIMRLRFSGDGQTLYSGGVPLNTSGVGNSDGVVYAWNVKTRQMSFSFGQINGPAFDVAPNASLAALGFEDFSTSNPPKDAGSTIWHEGATWLFDLNAAPFPPSRRYSPPGIMWRGLPSRQCKTHIGNIACVALTPDAALLAVGTDAPRNALSLWNANTAKQIPATNLPALTPDFLEWAPDNARLACASSTQIAIFHIKTGTTLLSSIPGTTTLTPLSKLGTAVIPTLAWSPDGQFLFSGGDQVRMWRASDLKLQRTFAVSGPVAVSPDGKTLATANKLAPGKPNAILLWTL